MSPISETSFYKSLGHSGLLLQEVLNRPGNNACGAPINEITPRTSPKNITSLDVNVEIILLAEIKWGAEVEESIGRKVKQ